MLKSKGNSEEALRPYRSLPIENLPTYLPDAATILNNSALNHLAVLQQNQNNYGSAQNNCEEVLQRGSVADLRATLSRSCS